MVTTVQSSSSVRVWIVPRVTIGSTAKLAPLGTSGPLDVTA